MREQRTKAQVKKNPTKTKSRNYKIIPTAYPPPTPCYKSTTPQLTNPPIICNNNTIDIEFLVQMRQSDKCGSVRNDDIFSLNLGSAAGPWVSIPGLLQDTSHIYWYHPSKQLTYILRWQIEDYNLKLCCHVSIA